MSISIDNVESKAKKEKRSLSFKLSPTMILILSVVVAIILSILIFFLYVSPQWGRVGQGREFDNDALTKELRSKEQTNEQLKQLKANLDSIPQDQLETIGIILPQEELVPEILNQLETVARTSGVNLTSVTVTEVQEADNRSARQRLQTQNTAAAASKGVKTLRIQLSVTAFQYNNYKRFVQNLQSNARIMDVQRLSFRTDDETHALMINTYYLPE